MENEVKNFNVTNEELDAIENLCFYLTDLLMLTNGEIDMKLLSRKCNFAVNRIIGVLVGIRSKND